MIHVLSYDPLIPVAVRAWLGKGYTYAWVAHHLGITIAEVEKHDKRAL